jgi:serine/threonine-protein kinase
MADHDIEERLRVGDIEGAANLARERGQLRRAAELLALVGRHADGVICAAEAGEWRLALDVSLSSGDERIVEALCDEVARRPQQAEAVAAHARIAKRIDVAARVLESVAPAESARAWYEIGDYAQAGRMFDRAEDHANAVRAYEQHLAQSPEDAAIAERLAELRAERGDAEGAVRALQAAVRAGATVSARRKLIDGLARLGLDGSARAIARRLQRDEPDASLDPTAYAGALPRSEASHKRYAERYRVVREVGSGATGRVLEALDELTGDPVALKVLAVGDDRGGAFARFMREAELARELDSPMLVRMRALDPEGPTIIYDWMPGGTLAERIGALSVREVRVIAMRLLAALEILHRHGVIHRDLKPSNVLFDPTGQARLGDLGAAHLGDLGATVTGGLVGSLPYMAPEQITGAPLRASTDLYAFGCVLYQMLTGRLPYPGPDFVTQHVSDPIPLVSVARPSLGTAYDAVVTALLAKDPDQRPAEVAEVHRMLVSLPWTDVDDVPRTPGTRASSIPPPRPPGENDTRLVAVPDRPGIFRDARLERDVLRIELPLAARDLARRWAGSDRSDLQTVFDLEELGDRVVAWVEPIAGDTVTFGALASPHRERVLAALASIALTPQPDCPVQRSPLLGTVVPVSVLATERVAITSGGG